MDTFIFLRHIDRAIGMLEATTLELLEAELAAPTVAAAHDLAVLGRALDCEIRTAEAVLVRGLDAADL